jgi:hypothetical protein
MLVYYTFDEGEGNVIDHSGRNLNGTPYGATYAVVGDGHALKCDGKSFAKCVSQRGLLFGDKDFTIECLLKLDAFTSGIVMGKQGTTPESAGWHVEYDAATMQLRFVASDGERIAAFGATLDDLNWHHLAIVRANGRMTIYLNGKAEASVLAAELPANFDTDKAFLFLGRLVGNFTSFDGKLDELMILSRALNAEQVATRYEERQAMMPAPTLEDETKARRVQEIAQAAAHRQTALETGDPLRLHYTFDTDPGDIARDLSAYGHDGEIIGDVTYHEQLDGRKGVVQFDGESSWIQIGNDGALTARGDMTIDMWARQDKPIADRHALIFGENPSWNWALYWQWNRTLNVWYRGHTEAYNVETHGLPLTRALLDDQWAHIAIVYEFPRLRTYRDGALIDDLYMPFPIAHDQQRNFAIGGRKHDGYTPLLLDEIRYYHRALTAKEIAARAADRQIATTPQYADAELFIEPHWYDHRINLRLHVKGAQLRERDVHFTINGEDRITAMLEPFSEHDARLVARATLPLSPYIGEVLTVRADVPNAGGALTISREHAVRIDKPQWVDSTEGVPREVPKPWTPMTARPTDSGIEINVWGRTYTLGENALPVSIDHQGDQMLNGPIVLRGEAGGRAIEWRNAMPRIVQADDLAVTTRVAGKSGNLNITVDTTTEFDGYIINDITITSDTDIAIDQLELFIPIAGRFAELCYGNRVYEQEPGVAISQWHSGSIDGELHFKVGPEVWIGNRYKGFTVQMETDEHWRPADPFNAITITPGDETATFVAHLIEQPTTLKPGQTLYYSFNFIATPAKPMLRDGWDLRIVRSEPWGKDLEYPNRTLEGKLALQYIAETGTQYLFTNVNHIWPFPMPRGNDRFAEALHRMIDAIHAAGLKNVPYLFHQRYPVNIADFDVHGLGMMTRPGRAYVIGPFGKPDENGVYARPGPITIEYGADSQGATMVCPHSLAMVDSYLHALGERYDTFGDDGIYLDGTASIVPCTNREHGCGYYDENGVLQPTFPARYSHQWMKRTYVATKQRGQDHIVDLHCSFGYNTGAVHFADNMWTGEQWHHLRKTGADHLLSVFPLDKFLTEFTGWQVNVASDLLFYRLGKPMRVASFAFLHDIPGRPSTPAALQAKSADHDKQLSAFHEQDYFTVMSNIWKMRDAFEIKQAKRYFYFDNDPYVTVEGKDCYVTFFHHHANGILAFITNLDKDAHDVAVRFDLEKLGLDAADLTAFDALTEASVAMTSDDTVSVSLDKEQWLYVWLKPDAIE